MTLAVMSGGFDLSVESVMALTSVFLSILIPVIGIPLAILGSLIVATSVGVLNGVIIAKLKVNPLITTLCMSTIIKGVALLVAGGRMIVIHAEAVHGHRHRQAPRHPHPIYVMVAFFGLFYLVVYRSSFGRHVAAVGSNESAVTASRA